MKRRRYKVVVLNGDDLIAQPKRARQGRSAVGWWAAWSWRLKLASLCYGAGALILLVRFV